MYLCLMVGQQEIPQALDGQDNGDMDRRKGIEVLNEKRRRKEQGRGMKSKKKGKGDITAKDWILKKKELYRTRGKEGYVDFELPVIVADIMNSVPRDSKYTARKRRVQF